MNKEQNMALVNLAIEQRELFLHFLVGWMSKDHHEDMAEAARCDLNYFEEGREILKKFDATLDAPTPSEV